MRAFAWFLGQQRSVDPLVDVETGSCRDGLHPDRPTRTGAASPWSPICSASPRFVKLHRVERHPTPKPHAMRRVPRRRANSVDHALRGALSKPRSSIARPSICGLIRRASSSGRSSRRPSHATSIPPTRRGPTTSSTGAGARSRRQLSAQLADVLENFQGRHRNLLETFEARADEMEEALVDHVTFHRGCSAGSWARISCTSIRSRRRRCSIPASWRIRTRAARPTGGVRFILSLRAVGEGHVSSLTFRSGIDRGGRQRDHRSDGAPGRRSRK